MEGCPLPYRLLPFKVDSKPGAIFDMRGFRVGRQAQMIPVLHSMADQEAAPTLSSGKVSMFSFCSERGTYRSDLLSQRSSSS